MTEDDFREKLRARISKTKNVTRFCSDYGIVRSHLYEFLAGNKVRGPSLPMLAALGFEYRIVRKR